MSTERKSNSHPHVSSNSTKHVVANQVTLKSWIPSLPCGYCKENGDVETGDFKDLGSKLKVLMVWQIKLTKLRNCFLSKAFKIL